MKQYRITRGKKDLNFHIEVRKQVTVTLRRTITEWLLRRKPKTMQVMQLQGCYREYVQPFVSTRFSDPRDSYRTATFISVASAQKKIDDLIAEDRKDNSYTGEWQP